MVEVAEDGGDWEKQNEYIYREREIDMRCVVPPEHVRMVIHDLAITRTTSTWRAEAPFPEPKRLEAKWLRIMSVFVGRFARICRESRVAIASVLE